MIDENTVVWTEKDYRQGWCRVEDVGKSVETAPVAGTVEPDPDPATLVLTTAAIRLAKERGIDPTDAEAMALIMLEIDPEGFAKRNPTIYLDILKNQRSERANKQSEMLTLATATAGQLKAMSTQTIDMHLALAIFAEADDVRDRMLARLNISLADLRAMADAGSD